MKPIEPAVLGREDRAAARIVQAARGMHRTPRRAFVLAVILTTGARAAGAQPPPPPAPAGPPPPWTGSAAFGLSLNRGNTATTNLNVSGEATNDPKAGSVWKFKGLYLRGKDNGTLAVDRLNLEGRNERALTDRVYAFGQLQFLEDQFKQIDYLWAPSVGAGYKLIATPVTSFNVDGGLGAKVEKNPDLLRRTDPVVTASDKLEYKLSSSATLTEGFGALWKVTEFGDALYTLTAGLAAVLTARTQLKVELLDTYATRPPTALVKSNDAAILTAVVYKF